MDCLSLFTFETLIVNYCSVLYDNTLQTCQESVPCIPHQMRKHTIFPNRITPFHIHIRKTCSPSSSRHRNITSRHSPSHSDTRWERDRSPSLSRTRRKRHESRSRSHSNPRKRQRHSRSHSRDVHTNKEHYRSQSRSKSRGSCSVLTSPHNASSHKGEMSLTTECLKYRSRSSSRYRKGTSNQRNNRS